MNKKIDKGFELLYAKLSYRRRFIRTLWLIPWAILALWLLKWVGVPTVGIVIVGIILFVVGFIQAFYNYRKWKEEQRENG